MDIAGIIPARGGSKGIPRKNIKPLNGKPVIAYSIEASLGCDSITGTYVSTEDDEIAEISERYGASIIERPQELAEDESSSIDVMLHALDCLEDAGRLPDAFVLLQPTSPLRTSEDIENAIGLFDINGCDSLVSVSMLNHQALLNFSLKGDYLVQNTDESYFNKRRQDMPTYYCLNGAIYITTPEFIRKNKSFYGNRTIPYIMPEERSADLDTPFDFKFIEFLLGEKK